MSELREKFLDYFDRKGHHVTASSSLVPEDPSMLFTSAGMVPFKPYFLGAKTGIDRAASCQKCFRTTDIDQVGSTIRHLTFFEMLGNFSFGDYFKEDAIKFGWDFLTNVVGLDPKRLYPTVFREDDEAEKLWKKVAGRPVKRLDEKDNFWAIGETGPCGPCSEIYYDLGEEMGLGPENVVGGDGDRYIEVWNLVFMEFDRQEDKSLKPLPAQNVDTGMGLERLTMIVEGKNAPFQTSLFEPIRKAAADLLGVPGLRPQGQLDLAEAEAIMAYRIISDHTRAAVMLAAEGIIPSNVERGYVLRRLIRRAARYGRLLGAKDPFLHTLVDPAMSIFAKQYPELKDARGQVFDVLRAEEERFLDTLEKGERELHDLLEKKPKMLSGKQAFKLYDTFGFPLELTREICARHGLKVDEAAFKKAQEAAADKSRDASKFEALKVEYDAIAQKNPGMRSQFTGYHTLSEETRVAYTIKYTLTPEGALKAEGGAGQVIEAGDQGEVILTRTPFYPEGGGQIGDVGHLLDDVTQKKIAEVHDTHKPHPDLIVHKITAHRTIRPNTPVIAEVDAEVRKKIAYHHTSTHLLNAALREVLGTSVRQAGSLVTADRLRFDFTHPKAVTPKQLEKIESIVNEAIAKNLAVVAQDRPAEDADKLKPVTLLGENYGDRPRFVLVGPKGWDAPMDRCSLELCGGTHVTRTGEIGRFKIVKESSVAGGTRRIEAVAGPALDQLRKQEAEALRAELQDAIKRFIIITSKIQSVSGKPYREVVRDVDVDNASIEDMRKSLRRLKDIERRVKGELASAKRDSLFQKAKMGQVVLEVAGVKLSAQRFEQAEMQTLRSISDQVKRDMGTGVVFLGSVDESKLSFVVGVTKDLVGKGIDASTIAKAVAEVLKGRAGGRKDFAQGGGPDYDWEKLVNTVKTGISSARS